MTSRIGICANPMSGRDVRRLAARASNMTFEAKRDMVARIVAGADAQGVDEIYIAREPFKVATGAVEQMPIRAKVIVVDTPLTNSAADSEAMVRAFVEAGCSTVVSLGGDGTNRAIIRAHRDITLLPVSTGTNNVFPVLMEPTIVGMVSALHSRGLLEDSSLGARAKLLHVTTHSGDTDVGVIDAVLLEDDHVGNMLPFDADKLRRILLTRAEPDAIGMSPIGGFIDVVDEATDAGLLVELGPGSRYSVPVSPGHFRTVDVASTRRVAFGEVIQFEGSGVLALDGDRDHKLKAGEPASVRIERDGPRILDCSAAMRYAVAHGMMRAD